MSKKSLIVRSVVALSAATAVGATAVLLTTGAHAAVSAPVTALPVIAPPTPGTTPPRSAPTAATPSARPAHPALKPPPAPLAAAALPNSAVALWKPIGPAHVQSIDHDVFLNECLTVHGAGVWQQQGYTSTFKVPTPAVEDSFTFAGPTAARRAYTSLLAGMTACQDQSRTLQKAADLATDAQVTRTATTAPSTATATATATGAGAAYSRRWTAVAGMSAPGPQTNHVYLVLRGDTVTSLQFTETAAGTAAYDTAGDSATLTSLTR